ncbi:MAG: DUF2062 domain-containing protein [Sedimentisphaerales bacterium]|nr:DUF2062 domain-containing protein [Sedimentisphaerales bacterium]
MVYRILHADDTPHKLALGLALGVFIGWTPTIGLQMLLVVLLAALLRANTRVGVPIVWISNPLTIVPIYWLNYQVGAKLLGLFGDRPEIHMDTLQSLLSGLRSIGYNIFTMEFWRNLFGFFLQCLNLSLDIWVGSILIGLFLAGITYVVSNRFIIWYRTHNPIVKLHLRDMFSRKKKGRLMSKKQKKVNQKAPSEPFLSLEYSHPLENWLGRRRVRGIMGWLTKNRVGRSGGCHLERALMSYGRDKWPLNERIVYWPIHKIIDHYRGNLSRKELSVKLSQHQPTVRGIVGTARSVAQLGLTVPQRWLYPLFVVWNFTNRCNLNCLHCYQSSDNQTDGQELALDEKLKVIDELGRNYVAMIAFAGGEPLLSSDLYPCLERCQHYGIHTTIATHGALLTAQRCNRLAELGLRYVEVSLDSVDPEKHDRFRGQPGMWRKAVEGIKNVVATEGLRAGLAMCVTRNNIDEVEQMLEFAVELGVSCFAHFNFIPVGRGEQMTEQDISPQQREQLLLLLHKWMQSRRIGVISTAPQLGRICLSNADESGLVSCSHAGNGPGVKARVVARYLGGCGAGRTYACLQPNGEVTPCVYMPKRTMGNIREKKFGEIFRGSPWWDLLCNREAREGGCGSCEYRNYCGGCRARSDAYFNRLDHSDPGCDKNQDLWLQLTTNGAHTEIIETNNPDRIFKNLKTS